MNSTRCLENWNDVDILYRGFSLMEEYSNVEEREKSPIDIVFRRSLSKNVRWDTEGNYPRLYNLLEGICRVDSFE